MQNGGGRDATKTGRSVLKFSEESARNGPGARKSSQNGKAENRFFIFGLLKNNKIHHTLIIINYSPHKNLHLGFRQKLGSKFCVPPLWQGGGRNATKSGRSVLKFSGESARKGPGARKSPQNGKTENSNFQKTFSLL